MYQNELSKAYLQHDLAYRDIKDLPQRATSDKILCNKGLDIAKNPKCDEYQRGLTWLVYKFFNKKFSGIVLKVKLH